MKPQDIREKTFEKAVFGGYDMGSVDDFMEEAAAELEAAQKEAFVLKSKLKVLVDKIEEYRASEDAMRLTLLSAQKLGAQIEAEAREQAEKIVSDADAVASRALESLTTEIAREEAKLMEAKTATAKFFEDARALCNRQLDYLDRIPEIIPTAAKKEAVIDDAVRSIENSVSRISDEPAPEIDITTAMEQPAPDKDIPQNDVTRLFSIGEN
ncbi:MAG: DivIVA domain-containing protein [Clostridia bacterium]|nr:DivIVA domain-containing protein [Clostridia bacterium]